MPVVLEVWLQFVLCASLIGLAGVRLSRYGDAIAAHTGLSRSWVGLALVATVTSLPELVTGLSAVAVANAPDIAAGDALGSCVVNLGILALIDVIHRRQPLFAVAGPQHRRSAALGAMLLFGAGLAIWVSQESDIPEIGPFSAASVAIVLTYLWGMRALYRAEPSAPTTGPAEPAASIALRRAVTGYGLASTVIVAMGVWLPLIGVQLAEAMGWTDSLVGSLFIAMATSVPEVATTWGAVRIGALDLAIGGLLGSNLFDVLILAVDDAAYSGGSFFQGVNRVHASTAFIAALMSVVVVVGLGRRHGRRWFGVASASSLLLLVLYGLNAALQFARGG